MENQAVISAKEVIQEVIQKNQWFPNNDNLPLLLYRHCFDLSKNDPCNFIKAIFLHNHWKKPWKNGIYSFHHYHSNTHEVIGICAGSCKIQIGGENGKIFYLEKGDALIIPAGVSHKNLYSTQDFICVGAYPFDIDYDMNKGTPQEYAENKDKIKHVALPKTDPVYGHNGFLFQYWK